MWDVVCLIESQFNDWKQTSWGEVDTDFMEAEARKFVLLVKGLNSKARYWVDARYKFDLL